MGMISAQRTKFRERGMARRSGKIERMAGEQELLEKEAKVRKARAEQKTQIYAAQQEISEARRGAFRSKTAGIRGFAKGVKATIDKQKGKSGGMSKGMSKTMGKSDAFSMGRSNGGNNVFGGLGGLDLGGQQPKKTEVKAKPITIKIQQ